jgi:hypothetical protein
MFVKSRWHEATERREAMTEEREIRATHEEVESFVGKLKEFHSSLDEGEQAMMDTILDSAQGETGGYARRRGDEASWNDLIGWVEEQDEEDTQGFRHKWR